MIRYRVIPLLLLLAAAASHPTGAALLDSNGAATETWDVQFYPTSFLIDSAGNIRYTAYGMINWDSDETRQIIEQLMPDSQAVIHETNARP